MARPPILPLPGAVYDTGYFNYLVSELRSYFDRVTQPDVIQATKLKFDIDTLPTEADVANLSVGDVYRDTTASNVLKVKV